MLTIGRCKHGPEKAATCGVCRLRDSGAVLSPREPDDSPRPSPSCVHRGASVPKGDGRDWAACDHPTKPLGPVVCPCRGCGVGCGGYEPGNAPVPLFLPGVEDPIDVGPYRTNPHAWAFEAVVRDRHKAALTGLVAREFTPPTCTGRAVLCGGGGRHWHMNLMLCRMLRENGYDGAIQFWYRGSSERIEAGRMEAIGAEVVNADAVADEHGDQRLPRGRVNPGGHESKAYAIAHTRFRQVIWFDADVVPHQNPARLLDALDKSPVAYWHEGKNFNIKWAGLGWPNRLPGEPLSFQSGHFAIDRVAAWKVVALANWMCQHSDFYFRHIWGDQDTFLIAMALAGVAPHYFGACRHVAGYGVTIDLDGRPFADHYYSAKLTLDVPEKVAAGRRRALTHFAAIVSAAEDRKPV